MMTEPMNPEELSDGVRTRKATEKGTQYQLGVKQKVYKRALSSVRSSGQKLRNAVLQNEGRECVEAEFDKWKKLCQDLMQSDQELRALLPPEDVDYHAERHSSQLEDNDAVQTKVIKFLTAIKHQEPDDVGMQDSASNLFMTTRTALSAKFSQHSDSASSTVSSARLREMQKQAELTARAALVKKRHEMNKRKLEMQCEEEEVELMTELAVSAAKTRAIDEFERELTGTRGQDGNPTEERPQVITTQPTEEVQATEMPRADHTNANTEVISGLVNLLREEVRQSHLPKLEPDVFHGDVAKFELWLKGFETYIENKTTSSVERLHYLGKYTAGEAKSAILGFIQLRTEDAYQQAKSKLIDRYGNEFVRASSYKNRIRSWPAIRSGDGKALREFADFLEQCDAMSRASGHLKVLDDPHENSIMLKKLPKHLVDRWRRYVDQRLYDPRAGEVAGYPLFKEFVKFLSKEARIACGPIQDPAGRDEKEEVRKERRVVRALQTTVAPSVQRGTASSSTGLGCIVCSGLKTSGPSAVAHPVDKCEVFLKMSLKERQAAILKYGLCRGCLKRGHIWRSCQRKKEYDTCGRKHPTSLHDDAFISETSPGQDTKPLRKNHQVGGEPDQPRATSLRVTSGVGDERSGSCVHSMILPVYVHHKLHPDDKVLIYAVLDPQSDACFVTESVCEALQVQGQAVSLELKTVTGQSVVSSSVVDDLVVEPIQGCDSVALPQCYSREVIPADRSCIPRRESARKWSHLKSIADEVALFYPAAEIGLLIGANCPKAVKPRDVITGGDSDPWAVRSALGWGIVGPVCDSVAEASSCQYVDAGNGTQKLCHFAFRTAAREVTPQQISQMFEHDFMKTETEKPQSVEDRTFVKKMDEGIHQREDGHYEMPLPLKRNNVSLPNNRAVAMQRLKGLRSKLVRNDAFRRDYVTFMEATVANGHAEKVPADELQLNNGRVWYLPHHGVYHPKKPDKIRVVFDCSAEFGGEVLNSHLLQGPDMTNSLTGLLCRFRRKPVALSCDIQNMFNQVGVNTDDRNYLRFLWWENGDVNQEPQEYRMTTHLFGARSSPASAMFALRKTADSYEDEYGGEAAEFVRRNFYIDDGIASVDSEEEAVRLINSTREMCARGGFQLHKLLSNRVNVLKSVPPESRCSGLQSLDVGTGSLPVQRALGVEWDTETDALQFSVQPNKKPATRRGILSTVSSIFDPLGFISPLILRGKQILKELCRDGLGWDDPVPDDVLTIWSEWLSELETLSTLHIPRCYTPSDFGVVKRAELHHFSDASTQGYGQCSYLRLVNERDEVCCRLVMSKARVTPSKPVTIPRLELTAALISVQVSCFLRKELDFDDITEFFWTDSKVTLGYIANEARRFHVFVGNRVQQIREHTEPHQWRYVESKMNPADVASRGANAVELRDSVLWWNGPAFLSSTDPLPESDVSTSVEQGDPEVRRVAQTATAFHAAALETTHFASLTERLERFSDWHRAKRAVALCLRYMDVLRGRCHSVGQPLTVEDLQTAETCIVLAAQEEAFQEELKILKKPDEEGRRETEGKTKTVKRTSKLHRLDPFVRADGAICVGGRIRRADLPLTQLHPVVLPRTGHITRLIVDHCHRGTHHAGRGMTIAEIRSAGYWIVGVRGAVSRHILNCVACKKIRGTPQGQKMSDLPEDRLNPAEPFTYSAVDLFGPFYVKERRSELKRWGVMFTCMASRAVHIETANTLSTDSFLNAFRRFVGRRGPVRTLRCDRGTNFVGGKKALEDALKEMDTDKIRRELLKTNCDWVEFEMNVPCASHMGGAWERMIRSARASLSAVLTSHAEQLDDEVLRTVMVEVEAVINSRPLPFPEMTQVDVVEPLTPSQILTQKTKQVLPPPGSFQSADAYCRQRWRRVQYLTNQFWFRWRAEVLPSLQERRRWTETRSNLQPGDVVLLIEADTPRNCWPLGRVMATIPSQDGLTRKAKVLVSGRELERPVHKLITLVQQPLQSDADRRPCGGDVRRGPKRRCRDAAPAGGVGARPLLVASRRRHEPAAPR